MNTEEERVLSSIEKLIEDGEKKDRTIKKYEEIFAPELSSKLTREKEGFKIKGKQAYFVSGFSNIAEGTLLVMLRYDYERHKRRSGVF